MKSNCLTTITIKPHKFTHTSSDIYGRQEVSSRSTKIPYFKGIKQVACELHTTRKYIMCGLWRYTSTRKNLPIDSERCDRFAITHDDTRLQALTWQPSVEYCTPPPVHCCFQHILFNHDLELWPYDPKMWHPTVLRWRKFGANVSNTLLQDVILTRFWDVCTDGRTEKQDTKHCVIIKHYIDRKHKNSPLQLQQSWCKTRAKPLHLKIPLCCHR